VSPFAILAGLLVAAHLAFVIFAVAGGVLVLRWRRVAWLHVPAVVWAAYIEVSGGICPLTPVENQWRARAGLDPYSGDFIARYVFPALYPEGLTFEIQLALGILVLVVNAAVYAVLLGMRRRQASVRVEQ
jgi:hypothetical protein